MFLRTSALMEEPLPHLWYVRSEPPGLFDGPAQSLGGDRFESIRTPVEIAIEALRPTKQFTYLPLRPIAAASRPFKDQWKSPSELSDESFELPPQSIEE